MQITTQLFFKLDDIPMPSRKANDTPYFRGIFAYPSMLEHFTEVCWGTHTHGNFMNMYKSSRLQGAAIK